MIFLICRKESEKSKEEEQSMYCITQRKENRISLKLRFKKIRLCFLIVPYGLHKIYIFDATLIRKLFLFITIKIQLYWFKSVLFPLAYTPQCTIVGMYMLHWIFKIIFYTRSCIWPSALSLILSLCSFGY